jgi:TolA-binding protein
MLEKLIIAATIALALSVYPAIKIYKGASIPMYQTKITKYERQIQEIKVIEQDPATRFVKIAKLEAKIVKLREKIAERSKVQKLRAQWQYQDEMIRLNRKTVYIDSTIKLDPK